MEKALNVRIHCRVSSTEERHLLNYQKEMLLKIAHCSNLNVKAISSEISKGTNPKSRELSIIKTHARRQEIGAKTNKKISQRIKKNKKYVATRNC